MFGGGGWVLFHKPPGNDFEVYNDFNGLLVNLYRCVRDKPEELMEALRYVLNAREDFDRIRSALARDSPASDVQRAAWFYQLIRYSYASGLTSFGSQPHDMRSNFSLIEQAHRRLAKVVIENKDFEKLLHQYDRPVSFFYLDPPYHATEGYYQTLVRRFTEADHIRLRDALMRIEGKFLLSYNDDALSAGCTTGQASTSWKPPVSTTSSRGDDNGAQFPELLIANYDLRERSRAVPSQMTLFDWNGVRQLDEQLSELEKLQQAAQLIEEMSQGRLQVCPSVVGQVYIRPQHDSNLGMDMRIDSIPGQPHYRITFTVQLRRMGTDMVADDLRALLSEVGQTYALMAALEARRYTPTGEDLTAFRDGLAAQQGQEWPGASNPARSTISM